MPGPAVTPRCSEGKQSHKITADLTWGQFLSSVSSTNQPRNLLAKFCAYFSYFSVLPIAQSHPQILPSSFQSFSPSLSLLAPEALCDVCSPHLGFLTSAQGTKEPLLAAHKSGTLHLLVQLNSCRSLLQGNLTHPGIVLLCKDRKLEHVISSGAFATSLVLGSYHLFY